MSTLDWHAERSDLTDLQLLDQAPESLGIDLKAVRLYRLGRVRAEMRKRDIAALVISDPVNIRYATGTRNMQVFCARNHTGTLPASDRTAHHPVRIHRLRAPARRLRNHR